MPDYARIDISPKRVDEMNKYLQRVVEKMESLGCFAFELHWNKGDKFGPWRAEFHTNSEHTLVNMPTPAEAICLAALKAVENK